MDIMETFSSLAELYQRIKPALRVKKREMHKEHMVAITEEDIWLYFCQNVWPVKANPSLSQMVDDILNTDSFTIYTYTKKRGEYGTNYS